MRIETESREQKQILQYKEVWPELPWTAWPDTLATLHRWAQVIGKIRLMLAPKMNHWWHVTLYPTCQGLSTHPMPYGDRMIQIDFDFLEHQLIFQTQDGLSERFALQPMSVAAFYKQVMDYMDKLGMPVKIDTLPSEIAEPVPFERDEQHAAYDAKYVTRFWQVLLQTSRVFTQFRSAFTGKVSPVHFFWGGFDLALTRFSGKTAPEHAKVPYIPNFVVQEAYSHEVISCGFWPGSPSLPEPVFYAYAYPVLPGYSEAAVLPEAAYFHHELGEFLLPYQALRQMPDPDGALLDFLQSTYVAAANLAHWSRKELEMPVALRGMS